MKSNSDVSSFCGAFPQPVVQIGVEEKIAASRAPLVRAASLFLVESSRFIIPPEWALG